MRLFDGDDGKRWCKNVKDLQLEILCVSQVGYCYVLLGTLGRIVLKVTDLRKTRKSKCRK